MLKKGFKKQESPEKMDIETTGIEMTRGTRKAGVAERLTGGNAAADESEMSKLVTEFVMRTKG